jgi:hypothetical protein
VACRRRCWQQAWVIDLDIQAFFGTVPHEPILLAVEKHAAEPWVLLYVRRWLMAPIQQPDGTLTTRDRGTPRGWKRHRADGATVGLEIVCRHHPDTILFRPRLTSGPSPTLWHDSPRAAPAMYEGATRKLSRRCPAPGCTVHPQYSEMKVERILEFLDHADPFTPKGVLRVTDLEMDWLIQQPGDAVLRRFETHRPSPAFHLISSVSGSNLRAPRPGGCTTTSINTPIT